MIRCTLPWPPGSLRPNRARTRHWAQNGTAAALYKSLCTIELREQGVGRSDAERISLGLLFCPPTKRWYDLDGSYSAFKPAQDALSVSLGIDDHLFRPITLDVGPVVKGGCVEVVIHEE